MEINKIAFDGIFETNETDFFSIIFLIPFGGKKTRMGKFNIFI